MLHEKLRLQGAYGVTDSREIDYQIGTDKYHEEHTGLTPIAPHDGLDITTPEASRIYIDAMAGDDSTGDGTSSAPYETLDKAFEVLQSDATKRAIYLKGSYEYAYTVGNDGDNRIYPANNDSFCLIATDPGETPVIKKVIRSYSDYSATLSTDVIVHAWEAGEFEWAKETNSVTGIEEHCPVVLISGPNAGVYKAKRDYNCQIECMTKLSSEVGTKDYRTGVKVGDKLWILDLTTPTDPKLLEFNGTWYASYSLISNQNDVRNIDLAGYKSLVNFSGYPALSFASGVGATNGLAPGTTLDAIKGNDGTIYSAVLKNNEILIYKYVEASNSMSMVVRDSYASTPKGLICFEGKIGYLKSTASGVIVRLYDYDTDSWTDSTDAFQVVSYYTKFVCKNDQIYVCTVDSDDVYKAAVYSYSGTSWDSMGSYGFARALNPYFGVGDNGVPFLAYSDNLDSNKYADLSIFYNDSWSVLLSINRTNADNPVAAMNNLGQIYFSARAGGSRDVATYYYDGSLSTYESGSYSSIEVYTIPLDNAGVPYVVVDATMVPLGFSDGDESEAAILAYQLQGSYNANYTMLRTFDGASLSDSYFSDGTNLDNIFRGVAGSSGNYVYPGLANTLYWGVSYPTAIMSVKTWGNTTPYIVTDYINDWYIAYVKDGTVYYQKSEYILTHPSPVDFDGQVLFIGNGYTKTGGQSKIIKAYWLDTPSDGNYIGIEEVMTLPGLVSMAERPETNEVYALTSSGDIWYCAKPKEDLKFNKIIELELQSNWHDIEIHKDGIWTFNHRSGSDVVQPGNRTDEACGAYRDGVLMELGNISGVTIDNGYLHYNWYAWDGIKNVDRTLTVPTAIIPTQALVYAWGIEFDGQGRDSAIISGVGVRIKYCHIHDVINGVWTYRDNLSYFDNNVIEDAAQYGLYMNGPTNAYPSCNIVLRASIGIALDDTTGERAYIGDSVIYGCGIGFYAPDGESYAVRTLFWSNGIDIDSYKVGIFYALVKRYYSRALPAAITGRYTGNPGFQSLVRGEEDFQLRSKASGYNFDSPYITAGGDLLPQVGAYQHTYSSVTGDAEYDEVIPVIWDSLDISETPSMAKSVTTPSGEYFEWSPNDGTTKKVLTFTWDDNTSAATQDERRKFNNVFRRLFNFRDKVFRLGFDDGAGGWAHLYEFNTITHDSSKSGDWAFVNTSVQVYEDELRGLWIYIPSLDDYMLILSNTESDGGVMSVELYSGRGLTIAGASDNNPHIDFWTVTLDKSSGQKSKVWKFFQGGTNGLLPMAGYSLIAHESWRDINE